MSLVYYKREYNPNTYENDNKNYKIYYGSSEKSGPACYITADNNKFNIGSQNVYVCNRLKDILGIYTYPSLKPHHIDLLQQVLDQGGHRDTTIIVPENSDEGNILRSIKFRYPVYFGGPIKEKFHEKKLKQLFGYTLEDIEPDKTPARFGVVGPITFFNYPHLDGWAIHVWGVNFEKDETKDYKEMVVPLLETINLETRNLEEFKTKYKKRQIELLNMILRGAIYASEKSRKRVQLRMPAIGMGAFLGTVSTILREVCKSIFVSVINELEIPDNIILVFCDYNNEYTFSDIDNFRKQKNLFNISNVTHDEVVCIVNAWDDRAFIGNGLLHDPTIDGFFVAGFGSGADSINSSYLHNAFFHNYFEDTTKWIKNFPKRDLIWLGGGPMNDHKKIQYATDEGINIDITSRHDYGDWNNPLFWHKITVSKPSTLAFDLGSDSWFHDEPDAIKHLLIYINRRFNLKQIIFVLEVKQNNELYLNGTEIKIEVFFEAFGLELASLVNSDGTINFIAILRKGRTTSEKVVNLLSGKNWLQRPILSKDDNNPTGYFEYNYEIAPKQEGLNYDKFVSMKAREIKDSDFLQGESKN